MTRGEQMDIFTDIVYQMLPGCKMRGDKYPDEEAYRGVYVGIVDCPNGSPLLVEFNCENMAVTKIWSPY